ncbi:MAG: thioredoxin fold domain-containing protein [Calditrichaeota bacterium]|nr:thioredoxin fold domain-containing protein [Calditrichota bacterium]
MTKKVTTIACLILLITLQQLFCQAVPKDSIVTVSTKMSPQKIFAGDTVSIQIGIKIKEGFHIYSHKPTLDYLKPTIIELFPKKGIKLGEINYPKPKLISLPYIDEKIAVYEGDVVFNVKAIISPNFSENNSVLKGVIKYQACNEVSCKNPAEENFKIPVKIFKNKISSIKNNSKELVDYKVAKVSEAIQLTSDEIRAKNILEKGLFFSIISFFVFGLALNLTPCVYPVIPLTVGFFGGQSDRRKSSSFLMALFYVFGIAIIFALLGLISSLAGKQWGFLFQNSWFVVIITIIILAMAASMFGAFEITIPAWLSSRLGKSRDGNVGAFVMGLTVGVVIAPCAAGIIIGLVGLVAKLGIVAKGTFLFFIMGLGLGLPYLILGTFSGLLNKLPQSGIWMVWVRKMFGYLLIGVALYFFLPQAKHVTNQQGFFFGLLIIFSGLMLGFLDHTPGYSKGFKFIKYVLGIVLILSGILFINNAKKVETSAIKWVHYEGRNLFEIQETDKPAILDFYTDYCLACKKMDKTTFMDRRVTELAKQFSMIKVNCSVESDQIKKLKSKYDVVGMPTYIFLDCSGNEIKELRIVGEIETEKFLKRMKKLVQITTE